MQYVLLYNSRLMLFAGKLRLKWPDVFMVSNVYPRGAIELEDSNKKKFMVNGKILKHYYVGGPRAKKIELVRFKNPQ